MQDDVVIELEQGGKVFGARADEAVRAIERRNLTNAEIYMEFDCYVGVADCSFTIQRGEIFCIMGLSGSGKSTVVRHLNRLIEPTRGIVRILGKDILALPSKELRKLRVNDIGMVFQHMALLPHLTVRDNVALPLSIRGESQTQAWTVAQECLKLVNLAGHEERFPQELSGGMQQRVGLARALASDPDILLMDEPFSALDPLIRKQLQNEFKDISANLNKTTVFITHDLAEAIHVGHRIAMMKSGRIVQIGTPQEITNNPIDDYVREFVEGANV